MSQMRATLNWDGNVPSMRVNGIGLNSQIPLQRQSLSSILQKQLYEQILDKQDAYLDTEEQKNLGVQISQCIHSQIDNKKATELADTWRSTKPKEPCHRKNKTFYDVKYRVQRQLEYFESDYSHKEIANEIAYATLGHSGVRHHSETRRIKRLIKQKLAQAAKDDVLLNIVDFDNVRQRPMTASQASRSVRIGQEKPSEVFRQEETIRAQLSESRSLSALQDELNRTNEFLSEIRPQTMQGSRHRRSYVEKFRATVDQVRNDHFDEVIDVSDEDLRSNASDQFSQGYNSRRTESRFAKNLRESTRSSRNSMADTQRLWKEQVGESLERRPFSSSHELTEKPRKKSYDDMTRIPVKTGADELFNERFPNAWGKNHRSVYTLSSDPHSLIHETSEGDVNLGHATTAIGSRSYGPTSGSSLRMGLTALERSRNTGTSYASLMKDPNRRPVCTFHY